jgi:uncharacterized membrane protein
MRRARNDAFSCSICGQKRSMGMAVHGEMVHGGVLDLIRRRQPDWSPDSLICTPCLRRFVADYVQQALDEHQGETRALDEEVVRSLREHDLVSENVNAQFEQALTLGQRIADRVASIGGSWAFIIGFGVVMAAWILLNSVALRSRSFDPYPYILLNLALSCLAAIQAPIIMMSQNRREAKDRMRSEYDYRVNLKAELEIRHLHSKLDQLLTRQWQRLLEIQQLQTEILEDLAAHRPHRPPEATPAP